MAATDFLDAATKGYDLGRKVRRDVELANVDNEPQAGLDTVQGPPQTVDIGTGADEGLGLNAVQTQAPQVDPAQAQVARAQRRADVMRRYGDSAGADAMLNAASTRGLTEAQTGEVRQRTAKEAVDTEQKGVELQGAKRTNAKAIQADKIRQEYADKIDHVSATPGDVNANHVAMITALQAAGLSDAAKSEADMLQKRVGDMITYDTATRQAAAKQQFLKVQNGDLSGLADFQKRFSYGINGGVSIQKVEAGPQPGTVLMTYDDLRGQGQQKVVPIAELQKQVLPMLKDAAAGDPTQAKQLRDQADATIKQHLSMANYQNAHAGLATANAESARDSTTNAKAVREARVRVETAMNAKQEPDPKDQAIVDAEDSQNASKMRSRINPADTEEIRALTAERTTADRQVTQAQAAIDSTGKPTPEMRARLAAALARQADVSNRLRVKGGGGAASPAAQVPSPTAIQALKDNASDPAIKAQFDLKYGKGAADRYGAQ
jgi:hypothetical protein